MEKKEDNNLQLWYEKPAKKWTEALPIGNGRLGAMIFGRVKEELIQLNEDTLWSGEPKDNNNQDAINHLEDARKLIFEEKYLEAESLVKEKMLGTYNQNYLPLGYLELTFNRKGKVKNYKRTLDLNKALVSIEYEQDDIVLMLIHHSKLTGTLEALQELLKCSSKVMMVRFESYLSYLNNGERDLLQDCVQEGISQ